EGREFEVCSGGPVAVGVDGEAAEFSAPPVFRSIPGSLRVRVPRTAGGGADPRPAERLNRGNIVQLALLALGRSGHGR
ncbi:MAG TPA: hypothetical protein VHN80_21525, partial [Kineosporiaceae bacterium]|nr:hypothetical protein [Kineosporiaceae bacterium]